MYYIYGVSVPSLLIESTDSMIIMGVCVVGNHIASLQTMTELEIDKPTLHAGVRVYHLVNHL